MEEQHIRRTATAAVDADRRSRERQIDFILLAAVQGFEDDEDDDEPKLDRAQFRAIRRF